MFFPFTSSSLSLCLMWGKLNSFVKKFHFQSKSHISLDSSFSYALWLDEPGTIFCCLCLNICKIRGSPNNWHPQCWEQAPTSHLAQSDSSFWWGWSFRLLLRNPRGSMLYVVGKWAPYTHQGNFNHSISVSVILKIPTTLFGPWARLYTFIKNLIWGILSGNWLLRPLKSWLS